MEAELRKAIDKLPVLHKAHIYEPNIDAVAELSFKAGMQEVVDWIGEHGRMTYARATGEVTFDHINYVNFLKEKGLK